jgi:hypothetical protein
MTDLKELFDTMAAEVRSYDVTASALRAARRRQRARFAAPLAAAIALAGIVSIAVVVVGRGGSAVDASGPASVPTPQWLPAAVLSAQADPEPLPQAAVGRGALLYDACAACAARLVTESGRQFSLPTPADAPSVRPVASLSADGTWLSYPDAHGSYVLRELTGTRNIPIGPRRPIGWFPDGTKVVLDEPDDRVGTAPQILTLSDGHVDDVTTSAGEQWLAGVTVDEKLVFTAVTDEHAGQVHILLLTPDGHTMRKTLSAKHDLGSGETLGTAAYLDPYTDGILVQTMRERDGIGSPGDLLRFDLTTGRVTRIRLPEPDPGTRPATGDPDQAPRGGQVRQMTNVLPEGVALVHWYGPAPKAVELLNPATGERTIPTQFSGPFNWVRLRGDVDTR